MSDAGGGRVLGSLLGRLPAKVLGRISMALGVSVLVSVAQLVVVAGVGVLGAALSSPLDVANASHLAWLRRLFPGDFWGVPHQFLAVVVCACLVAVLGNNALRLLNEYSQVRAMRETERYYSDLMLNGFFRLPYLWHVNQNSSDLVMAVYWASHYGAVVRSLLVISGDTFATALVLVGVFCVNPALALGALVVLGAASAVIYGVTRTRLDYYSNMYREASLCRVRLFNKGLQGIKDVKIFGCSSWLRQEADDKMAESVELAVRQELVRIFPTYALESLGFVLILGIVFLLISQEASYTRIAGTVTFVAAAGWKILPSVSKVLGSITGLRTSWPYVLQNEKYQTEIRQKAASAVGEAQEFLRGIVDGLDLEDVSFSYEAKDAKGVSQINMKIRKGQAIGLIGPSGAGKTTIINILSGLLQADSGRIKVDGEVLDEAAFSNWQVGTIGYVPQTPYICDGTIAENIAYGAMAGEIDSRRVQECCVMAAMDFIETLPDGIFTEIGERGVRLSGGQQQRIAIARALYKNPEIIIFDEATSALDTKNERTIQDTIYNLKGAVTLLIVAHRLTTVSGCDTVYWIDEGRVVMSGAPQEVLREYEKVQAGEERPGVSGG